MGWFRGLKSNLCLPPSGFAFSPISASAVKRCREAAGRGGWRVFSWTQVWTQIVEYGPSPDRTSGHV
jgi:hypothetical protein